MKLLKFHAEWCGPCKAMTALIENIREQIKIPIEEINVDHDVHTRAKYSIRSIPTFVLLNDADEEIKRNVGSMTAGDLLKFIE